ncbi:Mitogen-activated protein kinase kinase kinase [Bertholletia excelsa]
MRSWWGKSSSKEAKKGTSKKSFIGSLHRKFKGSQSRSESRATSPSKSVSRCQSFVERPQPLPLPVLHPANVARTDSGVSIPTKPRLEKGSKQSLLLPHARPGCIQNRPDVTDLDGDGIVASFSSEYPINSDDPADSRQRSPLASDYENGGRTATGSPRMNSPGPSSRNHSGAVTPLHPRAGGAATDDGKKRSHPLPLPPPITIPTASPFSRSNSAVASPSMPRSPVRAENPTNPGSCWKKGKLLGRGTFGHVYFGFNSGSGEMCAMKEVTLFPDDTKSKESAKQLGQEVTLLSRLRHPNIVQYYGSETVGDKLYIYLEYVSGGSIYKLLQEYGPFGELAIRSYTKQILSGLVYLHAKNTVHRDIKGANILVDPNGRVKLADFGMAKNITGQSCPSSFKGSPYWMAPEVINNSSGCNLAVDIWSLGCTVLEMATGKPPWSQYEWVAAMFKIRNSKDLPAIPDNLSNDGKDFVRQCLQRNPSNRPTAAQLLEHPFVNGAAPLEKPITGSELSDPSNGITTGVKSLGNTGCVRNASKLDLERLSIHSSRFTICGLNSSEMHIPRNISCPVSPIGSPLLHPQTPQPLSGRFSPSPLSSPCTASGSSTPLSGSSGAIPFHYHNQSSYLQFGGTKPKASPQSPYHSPSYNTANHDIFHGMQLGSHIFHDLLSGESEGFGNRFGRPVHREPYDGQSVLADRVSQQLLRDHVKLSPSLDLSSGSLLSRQTSGI